ncbi:hypothetical protein DFH06DRAFT_1230266 [Mycena polygramma]|nr:hypothetical protein DFH06DRAFT_1230266 [Mycena polygramma]
MSHVRFSGTVEEIAEYQYPSADSASKHPRFGEAVAEYEVLELDAALSPKTCPELDFSLPTAVFSTAVDAQVLNKSALSPPQARVDVRVPLTADVGASGLCCVSVEHTPRGAPVTVGDVLGTVHHQLRQLDHELPRRDANPREVERCRQQRVGTVDAFCRSLDAETRSAIVSKEQDARVRRVDRLCGRVLFAGLTEGDAGTWQLNLRSAERYAPARR